MAKNLDELFEKDNKRIDDSIQSELNDKVYKSIKNRSLIKGLILVMIALIGAGVFSWNLGILVL